MTTDDKKQKRIDISKKYHQLSRGNLWDIKDIEIPKLEFLCDKIIIAGEVHFLYGLGGTFKSTIGLYLAISMCAGVPTLFGNTIKSNILWIDEEMGLDGLMTKANLIANSIGLTDDDWKKHFFYSSMVDFNVEEKTFIGSTISDITTHDLDCIFVDSLTAVTKGETSENARCLRTFNKIAYRTGCAITHIHHIGKSDMHNSTLQKESLRGSIDYGNQVDMAFSIVSIAGHYRLKQDKGRHMNKSNYIDINFDIKEDDDGISFEYLGKTDEISKKSHEIRIDNAVEWLTKEIFTSGDPEIRLSEYIERGEQHGFSEDDIRDATYRDDKKSMMTMGIIKNGAKKGLYLVGDTKRC